ncbi:Pal1-domain-containing protein [Gyrodon lividus]|nr:Pal1-domain-containing protein [Gyrodon lividus]
MEPASEKSTNRGNATEPARDGSLIRSPGQSDGSPVGRRQISISTSDQSTIPSSSDIHLKDSLLSDTSRSSQHADIIDRLDFTGVGTMFHHDGPFDALAPSRNRLRIKAPILAWGSSPSEEASRFPGNNFSSSPEPYRRTYQKKQVRTVASTFWGIGEPEPYEEFFAGESTVDHDSGSRQEIPNTNTETRLKSAGSCMKGDAGTINTRELSGQDGDPTSESLKASHRKTSTADQAEAIQRARDRNHETSSVGNILDVSFQGVSFIGICHSSLSTDACYNCPWSQSIRPVRRVLRTRYP